MQLILLSKDRGHVGHIRLTSSRVWLAVSVVAFAVCAGAFYAGITAAKSFGISNPQAQVSEWRSELAQQQSLVDATRRALQQNVDALALRLGQMNAHVVRLDALGERLTSMAGLNDGEFDFSSTPSLGGPEELLDTTESAQLGGIVSALEVLDDQLDDRKRQLSVLEDLMLNRKLRDEVKPGGRPVNAGYISSAFGSRTDPFTGRHAFHKGVDFAGREGAEVLAVGAGVVIWPARGDQSRQRLRHPLRSQRRQPGGGGRHGAPRAGDCPHGRYWAGHGRQPALRGPAERQARKPAELPRQIAG
jgi:murein DD-endopeptidase MepM/ murein hydrolase activator NlpD